MKRLAAIPLAAAMVLAAAPSARADSSCNPGRSPFSKQVASAWIETGATGYGVTQIKGDIESQNGWANPGDATTSWIMLTPGDNHWIQVGYKTWFDVVELRNNFVSWKTSGGAIYTYGWYPRTTIDTFDTFLIDFTSGTSYSIYQNGVNVHSYNSSIPLVINTGWAPKVGEVASEANNIASQMPGGTADPVDFQNLKYEVNLGGLITYGASSHTTPVHGVTSGYTAYYGNGYTESNGHMWTWDKYCT
jgi:hypothetical protein